MQFQNLERMEDGQLSPGERNEAASSEEQGSTKAGARSYECTFCKRGFSNAQALGGHMNIHRKDRVKLKQPPSIRTHRFPFDVPAARAAPPYPPAFMAYASRRGFMFRDGDPHGERVYADGPQQLSLFMEGPSARSGSLSSWQHDEPGEPPNRGLATDLDLELRLGPEPPGSSTGLREFL